MAREKQKKTSLLGSLRQALSGQKAQPASRSRTPARQTTAQRAVRRDQLASYQPVIIDLDPLVHPTKQRHSAIPEVLHTGFLLQSQRHGIKCLLLDRIDKAEIAILKSICLRKSDISSLIYLPMGTLVLKDEVLHQGRDFTITLPAGTLGLSPGGHPSAYLLDDISLPLKRELSSIQSILLLNEATARKNLQALVDVPLSFRMAKEDQLYPDCSQSGKLDKGTLMVSRSGAVTGFLLEDVHLPLSKPLAELESLFPIKTTYQSYPIETLIQRAVHTGDAGLPLERGTFLFSPHGKVYFVWKDGVRPAAQMLKRWGQVAHIVDPGILNVSTTQSNRIGGPGQVISQEELNYLHDVFRQTGTTNINKGTLLLDRNVFYKFTQDMPYAHTGKYRMYLRTGQVVMLNTFRKGTFNVEMGGKDITLTDRDLVQIRTHLEVKGRVLIKIGTLLRITDERRGDWIYHVCSNLFYPYDTLTRPYMEEFIPDSVLFKKRAEKISTIIGPQENPHPEDKGVDGAPLADLLAMINLELSNERVVFVLDGTLFHWRGRLYRVNQEMVFRPGEYDKVENPDLTALESEWIIHPLVDEAGNDEEEVPSLNDTEEDLQDLPFDTSARR